MNGISKVYKANNVRCFCKVIRNSEKKNKKKRLSRIAIAKPNHLIMEVTKIKLIAQVIFSILPGFHNLQLTKHICSRLSRVTLVTSHLMRKVKKHKVNRHKAMNSSENQATKKEKNYKGGARRRQEKEVTGKEDL